MPRGIGASSSDRPSRSLRFALSTPPLQRRAANDEVKKRTMTNVRAGLRATFYIANCDPEISGLNRSIFGCVDLHFETSVSICNACPYELDLSRALLRALLVVLN